MGEEETCPKCGGGKETVEHMLLHCEDAKHVWYISSLRIDTRRIGEARFREWVDELARSRFDDEWWVLFWCLCWQIWLARNAWVFDHKRVCFREIVEKALRGGYEYVTANIPKGGSSNVCESSSSWCAPPNLVYKLNTDAAMFKNNRIGLGGVVRNHKGDVMMATCVMEDGGEDVDVAEALSARHGIQVAVDAGFRQLILEVDCLKLFNYLREGRRESSPFGFIVQDIFCAADFCSNISFAHVRRSGNKVAHNLAKLSLSHDACKVWLEEVPLEIVSSVICDISG